MGLWVKRVPGLAGKGRGDEMRELGWCLEAIALEEGEFAIED